MMFKLSGSLSHAHWDHLHADPASCCTVLHGVGMVETHNYLPSTLPWSSPTSMWNNMRRLSAAAEHYFTASRWKLSAKKRQHSSQREHWPAQALWRQSQSTINDAWVQRALSFALIIIDHLRMREYTHTAWWNHASSSHFQMLKWFSGASIFGPFIAHTCACYANSVIKLDQSRIIVVNYLDVAERNRIRI